MSQKTYINGDDKGLDTFINEESRNTPTK
jgi:hypothetical protein